jgi:3',5'-cyclic AMP phosphodiesterase CpdA
MITLAHLSDIHLAPLPRVGLFELFSKRITGYVNWKMHRKDSLSGEGLKSLVRHLKEQRPDFTAVTGDLVNLGLGLEMGNAARWLEDLDPPDKVCVSPGNHDAYVRGALQRAGLAWTGYMGGETLDESPFPFVRRMGDVAIISCSSAVPTMPFVAAGRFEADQAARLARCLNILGEAGYFRVVLIHHPPNIENAHARLGLWGARLFRDVIREAGAELILHGHTHKSSIHAVQGPSQDVPVIGVAAAGAAPEGKDDPARYNLFKIERTGTAWSCSMREFGFQRLGTEIVMRLQMRIY